MLTLLTLTGAVPVTDAVAQNTRSGMWGGFGVGDGSFACENAFTCHRWTGEARRSIRAMAQIGGAVSNRVLAGVQAGAWRRSEGTASQTVATLGPTVRVYLARGAAFYLQGTLGLSVHDLSGTEDDIILNNRTYGLAGLVGVGDDIRVRGKTHVTVGFNLVGTTAFGDAFDGSRNMWQLVIGPSWF